jgi:DNA-binding SARP family transcriptional activator
VDFAVLGPLEARDGGTDLTPAAAMPRRVLATLLLNSGRVVPIPVLVEELWGGAPPRLARKTVQTYLCQLRKQLAAGPTGAARHLLETRPQGYRIRLQPGELDVELFEQRAAEGRAALATGEAARAAELLRDALSLWRGGALTDLVAGPVLAAEVGRLEDARLSALEQRVEADMRLGRHRELLGELKALIARYPVHEELCAQLMRAAYRAGHRGEALGAYVRLRRAVVQTTGLEPSERLQRLHWAVLSESPSLTSGQSTVSAAPAAPPSMPAARPPAELPVGLARVTGRDREAALLRGSLLRRADGTEARAAMALGAPGSGKTTLIVHLAHQVRRHFPDGQFYATLHSERGAPVSPLRILQGFLRAAGEPDPPHSLEESARMFRTWTADRRVLVVLDDAASVQQVAPLLSGGGHTATLIGSRRRLPGLPTVTTVELGGLCVPDATALLASVAGDRRIVPEQQAAWELVDLCDRLPLAIRTAGERLAARPSLTVAELVERMRPAEHRLSELRIGDMDVPARLSEAFRRLNSADQRVLKTLGSLGPGDFGLAAAAGTLGADIREAEHLVDRLVDAHMVQDIAGVPGLPGGTRRFRMPDLVRLASGGSARHGDACPPPVVRRGLRPSGMPRAVMLGRRARSARSSQAGAGSGSRPGRDVQAPDGLRPTPGVPECPPDELPPMTSPIPSG